MPTYARRTQSTRPKRTSRRQPHALRRPHWQNRQRDVSIIIPACNEAATLRRTLLRIATWPDIKEVIVVANGCTDTTAAVARRHGALLIEFAQKLGHDTGRAVGAKMATGDLLLFLDADINWQRRDIKPFLSTLRLGADLALNRYPLPSDRTYYHPTAIAKRALNWALDHPEWKAASLTTVPHAMRKSALDKIGANSLAIPPLAFTRAVLAGLRIARPHYVNVGARNRWSKRYRQSYSTKEVILGDHVQAFAWLLSERGVRGGFSDGTRTRQSLDATADAPLSRSNSELELIASTTTECMTTPTTTVVIPAHNEYATLPHVLHTLKKLEQTNILVVENGSNDGTEHLQGDHQITVWHFPEPLGHDVGRSIAAKTLVDAACVLFLDGDFLIPPRRLDTFRRHVLNGTADVALNHLGKGVPLTQRRDAVSTMKIFLNLTLRRPKLGLASLTAIPHALSKKALETIPVQDLAVPPKAYTRAILSGLKVKQVAYVEVVKRNRPRPELHAVRYGSQLAKLIIGDHLEAISLLIQERGIRAGFSQPRRLDVLGPLEAESGALCPRLKS